MSTFWLIEIGFLFGVFTTFLTIFIIIKLKI